MLKSLFGELTPQRDGGERRDVDKNEFASTAVMETVIDETDEEQVAGDRHLREVMVSGSVTEAIRTHLATAAGAQGSEQQVITLFDPAQMWAAAVVKALSDASGEPIEKLQLRDQATMNSIALIERTTLPRRHDETIKVYCADVQSQAAEGAEIPHALMERSDMAAIIIGPLQAAAVDGLLAALQKSARHKTWRCTDLLFLLPVDAGWINQKIEAIRWPTQVRITTIAEPLTSASTVWNKLLEHWNHIRPHPADVDQAAHSSTPAAAHGAGSAHAGHNHTPAARSSGAASASPSSTPSHDPSSVLLENSRRPPDVERAGAILHELMMLDGLIFTALVDAHSGLVVTSEGRGPDIERAAAAATEVMRVHQRTLRQMGHWRPTDPVDEILVTAGSRYHILRTLQSHPDYFILAVLDKLRSNLAMTRFRIMEAQQVLA